MPLFDHQYPAGHAVAILSLVGRAEVFCGENVFSLPFPKLSEK